MLHLLWHIDFYGNYLLDYSHKSKIAKMPEKLQNVGVKFHNSSKNCRKTAKPSTKHSSHS